MLESSVAAYTIKNTGENRKNEMDAARYTRLKYIHTPIHKQSATGSVFSSRVKLVYSTGDTEIYTSRVIAAISPKILNQLNILIWQDL
jgi:hypothetical protein